VLAVDGKVAVEGKESRAGVLFNHDYKARIS
jgi:hypothetical protein